MAACVLSMEGSQHWCKHSEEIGYLQFGYGWSKLSVLDSLINELKLKLVSKHKRSIPLPKKNHSWICKFIIRINMETRHEWEEKTGQAVFKGTVLSMQSGAHASCSGGCGSESRQMVTSAPLVTLLPVAATSQAGSSHAQHYHAFISYTIITDPEEYTSQQEWNGKIIQHHDTFVIHCWHCSTASSNASSKLLSRISVIPAIRYYDYPKPTHSHAQQQ